MNHEGIAELLYDTWRASLVRERLLITAPVEDVTLDSVPGLAKQSRLTAWNGLSRAEKLHWIDIAKVAQEIIAAAVTA